MYRKSSSTWRYAPGLLIVYAVFWLLENLIVVALPLLVFTARRLRFGNLAIAAHCTALALAAYAFWNGNGAGRSQRSRSRSTATARRQNSRSASDSDGRAGRGRDTGGMSRRSRPCTCLGTAMAGKMQATGKRLHTSLISTAELAAHLSDADWFVADCRFELGKPDAGRAAWREGHIPGAAYVDLECALSAPVTGSSGRHPLPTIPDFVATLSRLGVDRRKQVVCYDAGSGAFAARLWWMLRWVGHDAVAVLDGGFAAWTAEGRPASTGDVAREPARFEAAPRPEMVIHDAHGVMEALVRSETLVDVRGAERFEGRVEPIDAVAGHVPGAVNLPYTENLAESGRFRTEAELAKLWRERTGATTGRAPICMCGSGVTACHGLLALAAAGVSGGRLYAGSWSEWIRDPSRPVARGKG